MYSHVQSSLDGISSWAIRVGKPSPSISRMVVIEKDGSIYELMFSRDFGVRRKNLKEEEPSVLFLKNTFYQNCHVFLKHAQDDLPSNLRSSGCKHCRAHSLSASPLVSLWLPSSLCRVALSYLSSAIPSEGKNGDQMVELWSQRKWVPSAWSCCSSATSDIFTCGAWDQVITSNQVTLSGGDKQSILL